ncbi:unnamed protein product [Spirodela intermedia]|uniref:Uncharacterized protein n=1 Tax=Spirodela intermedia TaxID=51605 RepID=A0A7I8IM07_SPIIN|nr:unnamed protein product [Spirodela intermedia]CAA6658858.1 unnamed protein product [Spirodela intermedia]
MKGKRAQGPFRREGLEAAERRDLFLARLSLLLSLCSFSLAASSFWYSAASDLALAILFFLSAILARFLCSVRRYVLTYLRTSSSLERLKSFLIFEALFGPLILGFSMSVNPGRSFSPFFTMTRLRTERSGLTMHPRTDFLRRSPFLLPYPRKQGVPHSLLHGKPLFVASSHDFKDITFEFL